MKLSTILDHIDSGHMALPEFQRGYVWNRNQVRGLMASLYARHPVGSLLVWATESRTAATRGNGEIAQGIVKLLLGGQQRITSLYGIIRGKAPAFFDGDTRAFTGLYFHLADEQFSFFMKSKISGDPLWIDVSKLFLGGNDGLGACVAEIGSNPDLAPQISSFIGRMSRLLGIAEIDFHAEEVAGADKTLDVVVDIFNRVNSGGTKLSKGDLALARICAEMPEARDRMKSALGRWRQSQFDFSLDWLLRCVNTVLNGEAKFHFLHNVTADDFTLGLKRTEKAIDQLINIISSRLGLDHQRVLSGVFAMSVMARYVDQHQGSMDGKTRDKLLCWYVVSAMRGRFSGSTESFIDRDLQAIETVDGGLSRLMEQLRLAYGGLRVLPGHFKEWGRGSRFYPVLGYGHLSGDLNSAVIAEKWGTLW
jgi:hypothetical protein